MNRSRVIGLLGEDWQKMKDLLAEFLRSDVDILNRTNASILENAGKMLRPMLCLLMAKTCGKTTQDTVRYAVAAEMLHNATLFHDDVADESSQRRGRPTVASVLGPSSAVLLGDFWLSRAVDAVLAADDSSRVVKLFSRTLQHLAEGEMLQLEKAGTADTDFDAYYRIIFCKTASLFEVSGLAGAISSGASEKVICTAGEYSKLLGIAFQIKDDILDYCGDEHLGKPTGVDLRERKITLPLLCALEGSPREDEIRTMVRQMDSDPGNESRILGFVKERDGVRKAAYRLEEYVGRAVDALKGLPSGEERDALEEIACYNLIRNV